jgi:preprotein translocase subunit SecE
MNKFISFIKESRTEMTEQVTWTKWPELQRTSIVVLIASLIFALVIAGMDVVFQEGIKAVYNLF